MIAVIAADELDTASSMPRLRRPASSALGDLDDLLGDERQRFGRQEAAEASGTCRRQRRDRKVAGERDEEQQRREQREEEVVGQLRGHRQAVVLPEGLVRRPLQNLPPRDVRRRASAAASPSSRQKAWPMLK